MNSGGGYCDFKDNPTWTLKSLSCSSSTFKFFLCFLSTALMKSCGLPTSPASKFLLGISKLMEYKSFLASFCLFIFQHWKMSFSYSWVRI